MPPTSEPGDEPGKAEFSETTSSESSEASGPIREVSPSLGARALGESALRISPVVFGAMGFGDVPDEDRERVVRAALDAGITTFDTAPLYGFGASERLLGRALIDDRERIQLLTKVGLRWDDVHGEVLFEFEQEPGVLRAVRRDSRPDRIVAEVEASLKRLRTDYIDLIQIHHLDLDTPLKDSLAALTRLQEQGKVRGIGLCNVETRVFDAALEALGPAGLASVQNEYSLLCQEPEAGILSRCAKHGVGFISYSSLAQGLLAGRMSGGKPPPTDFRSTSPRFQAPNLARITAEIERTLRPIAAEHGASLAQVSLAWLLGQPAVSGVIVGAGSVQQARDNAAALNVRLSPAQRGRLTAAFGALPLVQPRRSLSRRVIGRVRRGLSRLRGRA